VTGDSSSAKLPRVGGLVQMPERVPRSTEELLQLMDDACAAAAEADGATAPAYDHGMRVFAQLNAHYQVYMARELTDAHIGLKRATDRLSVATWWLVAITVTLAAIEIAKVIAGH